MADPNEHEQNILGGRLLGSRPVQDAVAALGSQVSKLTVALGKTITQIEAANRQYLGGGSRASNLTGNRQWNANSNWGAWGSRIGGSVTWNGATYPQHPARIGAGSGPTMPVNGGGPLGNGGNPAITPHQPQSRAAQARQAIGGYRAGNLGGAALAGTIVGHGIAGGMAGLTAWGDRMQGEMMQADTVGTFAANTGFMGGRANGASQRLMMGRSTAHNAQDLATAQMIALTTGGARGYATGGFRQSMGVGGILNPLLTETQRAQAQQGLTSAQMHNTLRMFGIQTTGRGGPRDQVSINADIARRFGLDRAMSGNQIRDTFMNQNSGINQTLRSLGMSPEQISMFQTQAAQEARIRATGGDLGRFRSLASQAAGQGDAAQQASKLLRREFNYTTPAAQDIRQQEAARRDRNLETMEGWRQGIKLSSDLIGDFNQALQAILRGPLGNPAGFGAAALGNLGSWQGVGGTALGIGHGALAVAGGMRLARMGAGAGAGAGTVGRVGGLARAVPVVGSAVAGTAYAYANRGRARERAGDFSLLERLGVTDRDYTATALNAPKSFVSSLFGGGGGEGQERQTGKRGGGGGKTIKMMRPVSGKITSPFGQRRDPMNGRLKPHSGIDFDGNTGTPIRAAADGTVIKAGASGHWAGNQTIIDHGSGLETMYAHQASISVRTGTRVRRGQVIGTVGSTGRSTGSHLHFEVHRNGTAVNPAPYIGAGGMVGSGNNANTGHGDAAVADTAGSEGAPLGAAGSSLARSAYGSINESEAIAQALSGGIGAGAGASGAVSEDNGAAGSAGIAGGDVQPSGTGAGALRRAIAAAGFRGTAAQLAFAVGMGESQGNPRAYNGKGRDRSYGLFQINMLGQMGPDRRRRFGLSSNDDLFDPMKNAEVAYKMSNGGRNWGAWSAYTNGSYRKYMNQYEKGAFNIDNDQTARVHRGEMIIPARQASTIRDALLKESVPNAPQVGGRNGGKVSLQFAAGAITIKVDGAADDESMRRAARKFVDIVAEDNRLERMGEGR